MNIANSHSYHNLEGDMLESFIHCVGCIQDLNLDPAMSIQPGGDRKRQKR